MLSWAMETINNDWTDQPPKMVTGRVTQNLLAVFNGGNREILEVKLKLAATAKVQRPEPQLTIDLPLMRSIDQAMTPTGTSEWNSFLQSNPQLGHSVHISRVASPALSQGYPPMMGSDRRDSFGPIQQGMPTQEVQRVAPIPVDPTTLPAQQGPSSRPASRTSKKKPPTGRPRGRPRKKPAEGTTSGYEDGTEGEDGPVKKRAKTTKTKVAKAASNPFAAGLESLRVAASTSGSIRNFRPIGNNENVTSNHLQEVPRAPTPVPEGGPTAIAPRAQNGSKLRRASTLSQDFSMNNTTQIPPKPLRALSPSQEDGRSPESGAPTPNYSEDSPQEIGSSPPLPHTTPYMRSSPPPSSPVLPPMHQPQLPTDVSFQSTDVDALLEGLPVQQIRERNTGSSPAKRPVEVVNSTGIPTQVFRLKDGPDGQKFVHIRNYNTQRAGYIPLAPLPQIEAPSLPPLNQNPSTQPRKNRTSNQKGSKRQQPTLAPTPPPTTDTIDKHPSPVPEAVPEIVTKVIPGGIPQAVPETAPEAAEPTEIVKKESPVESTLTCVEDALLSLQQTLPVPAPKANPPKPRRNRKLNRSQSASAALALPSVPASEPLGPSSLSQSMTAEISHRNEAPSMLRRSNSIGPSSLPMLASDPIAPPPTSLHLPTPAFSEAPCPRSDAIPTPSSPPFKSNKNLVKKQSIKLRLEKAIENGEMPPFCANCGSINTPTWRKIWVREYEGVPEYFESSEKPGKVTAIEILRRDEEDKPLAYRMIKKSLGYHDDKCDWTEQLLCNPCGIWLAKYRKHRPEDMWDNGFGPLGQDRKRGASANAPNHKAKRARTKTPGTEADLWTDPSGRIPSSPKYSLTQPNTRPGSEEARESEAPTGTTASASNNDTEMRSNPGSTHSRGSGTARSPIAIDLDMGDVNLGNTRRVLFPSPKKSSPSKVLGEVSANIVTITESRQNKEIAADKENVAVTRADEIMNDDDDLETLFRSPATARPSTPPPKDKATSHSGPFKTPTRPTPSHRPITRSVSRSLRSAKGMTSPNQQALLQRTPTRTPRSSRGVIGSGSLRRSPRNHQMDFGAAFDTPISRAISQVLSEPNFDFANSDFDISSLPTLDTSHSTLYDFGNLLSTDPAGMPSSPPKDGLVGFDFSASADVWTQWGISTEVIVEENKEAN